MKFLDLLDEKIDYLFKRGKNADERCYDFFIRTITFLLVELIVLCYASFVHASSGSVSGEYTSVSSVYGDVSVFNSTELNNWLSDGGYQTSDFSTVGICNGLSSYLYNTEDLPNLVIPTSVTYGGKSYNPEDYIVLLGGVKVHDYGVDWLSVYVIVGDDVILGNGGTVLYSFEHNFGIFEGHVNQNNLSNQYPDNPTFSFMSEGNYVHSDYDSSYYYYSFSGFMSPISWTNAPCYTVLKNENTNASYNDFALVHQRYPEQIFQINYQYAINNPPEEPIEEESDSNNLYLDELQVGLTSNVNGQDLLSSEVLIGVSTENNWIINHIDNYDLNIIFRFNIKDTFPSSPNDPSVDCQFSAPLRTFLDEPYQKSIIDIMKSSQFDSGSTYSNFYQYYTDLVNANNYHVVSSGTFKGIIPLITETMYEGLFGNYTVVPPDNPNFTIFNFNLEVICWLTSDQSLDESGNYSKSFDFLNGVSSINSAGIFKNNNPWEGEQIPSSNPLIPSGGSPVSGGGGGGNVNVTVNNNGNHKIPLNVHTKKELDNTINNYGEITDTFFDTYKNLTDETKEDGYISLLRQTLPEVSQNVPIIDFMLKCAICVIALGVIIFVLKVLLF